ncbi:MAG: shikimate kinase [Pseudomonadota bacterium]
MNQRLFLVGPMGAGKSAVGKRLAHKLACDFVDCDSYIEQRTGVDIAYIFEREGERGFRKRECQAIQTLTQRDHTVVATGGGVVMDPANRSALVARGTVIYLHASVAQQYERVRHGSHRPLLDDPDPQAVLQRLFDVRDPLYRSIADLTIATDGARVPDVADNIARVLNGECNQ